MILDHTGRQVRLKKIEIVQTDMIINGVEHTGFNVLGTNRGLVCVKSDMTEQIRTSMLEQLTEEFEFYGEPVN